MTFAPLLCPGVARKSWIVAVHLPGWFHWEHVPVPPEACRALVDGHLASCCPGPGGGKEGQLAE